MSKVEHSCKVPKLFKVASKILQLVQEKGASLKELVFDKGEKRRKHPNTKGLYALVVASIQNGTALDCLIRESKILVKEQRLDPWLARILIVELLWGKKKLPQSDAKPINTVLEYQPTFLAILREAVKSGMQESQPRRNKAELKPRYVRVNTLLMSVGDAVQVFREEGWRRATAAADDYASFLEKLSTLENDEFIQDFHIKQLFAFPPRTEFFNHELYQNGSFILQDKATCLASFLLDPTPGSSVMDMCAAPGMKTTQLAAIMGNKGTLYAVERHAHRYKTLSQLVPHHGVKCVRTIHADATTITPLECQKVKYILVDPSCSGSGMPRPTAVEDGDIDRVRLKKLAEFQVILLEKALVNFPDTKRVVYSTCSLYPEENEEVVEKVLKIVNTDPERPKFKLAENVLESWPNRGSSKYKVGPHCLISDPDKDLTTGCFIAVFERVVSDTEKPSELKGALPCGVQEEGSKKKPNKHKRKRSETREESHSPVNKIHKENGDKLVGKKQKHPDNESIFVSDTEKPSELKGAVQCGEQEEESKKKPNKRKRKRSETREESHSPVNKIHKENGDKLVGKKLKHPGNESKLQNGGQLENNSNVVKGEMKKKGKKTNREVNGVKATKQAADVTDHKVFKKQKKKPKLRRKKSNTK